MQANLVSQQRSSIPNRLSHTGANWLLLFIWCAVAAVFVWRGRYPVPVGLLLLITAMLLAIYSAIHVIVAVSFGVRDIEEVGIWLGPAILWHTVRGVLLRVNVLPIGAYVKFPASKPGEAPKGISRLNAFQKVTLILSAPLCCTIVGWVICIAFGINNGPQRAFAWFTSDHIRSISSWRAPIAEFLAGINSLSGVVRAFGILMLANGIINLLPLPVLSGGTVVYMLFRRVLGRGVTGVVMEPIGVVGTILLLTFALCGLTELLIVVFGHGV
jgi:membrane-associated protease RseP (regulator of RpoE activity)